MPTPLPGDFVAPRASYLRPSFTTLMQDKVNKGVGARLEERGLYILAGAMSLDMGMIW